jgi:lipopolysaccharide transport protein LptA
MKAPRTLALAAALSVALSGAFSAAPARAGDPLAAVGGDALGVQAEHLEVDVLAGSAVLTGNVSLTKGGLKVSCPRIDLKFNETPAVSWAKGSGGVTADVKGVHGEAPEVELDLAKQTLELRGGVRLARGQGWLQAERATIDIASGKVQLTQVKGSIPVPR